MPILFLRFSLLIYISWCTFPSSTTYDNLTALSDIASLTPITHSMYGEVKFFCDESPANSYLEYLHLAVSIFFFCQVTTIFAYRYQAVKLDFLPLWA